jgi:chromosomal replication initiation ATPase DnaA
MPMAGPGKPRQLPLDLGHATARTRDDLVVTPANREAVALVDRWPEWPAPVAVLWGPPGSGKTHLAQVWREASGAVTVEPGSIGAQGEAATALIDDADCEGLDETGLFHLINALRQSRGHLLLTARRPPAAWNVTLPDLASRLQAATLVELRAPDDMLLAGVITKLFADRQVDIDPQVVQFLVWRIERSLAAAMEAVDRLDRAALEQKSRITRSLAAALFRDSASDEAEWGSGGDEDR